MISKALSLIDQLLAKDKLTFKMKKNLENIHLKTKIF